MDITAAAQLITAPAKLITAPAQPPATGAVVYTVLLPPNASHKSKSSPRKTGYGKKLDSEDEGN